MLISTQDDKQHGENSMKLQEALNGYLLTNVNQIQSSYEWDFPTKNLPTPYAKKFNNDYKNSLDLRAFIHDAIKSKSAKAGELQAWYVRDWGGVKTNSPSTLDEYIQTSSVDLIQRGDKGIASWSKMLSVRDPSKYAIYDARVAMSLNTISLTQSSESTLFFPQLASRNKKIVSAQAAVKMHAKRRALQPAKYFYNDYLNLLSQAVKECGNKFDIQTAEMVLFANAEILASHWAT
jgi:hypothetical protein